MSYNKGNVIPVHLPSVEQNTIISIAVYTQNIIYTTIKYSETFRVHYTALTPSIVKLCSVKKQMFAVQTITIVRLVNCHISVVVQYHDNILQLFSWDQRSKAILCAGNSTVQHGVFCFMTATMASYISYLKQTIQQQRKKKKKKKYKKKNTKKKKKKNTHRVGFVEYVHACYMDCSQKHGIEGYSIFK